MPFWKCYYHVTWATKHREPSIALAYEQVLFAEIRQKANELKCEVLEVNGVADHVHLAMTIPSYLAVATCIGQLKGASSRAINTSFNLETRFHWQEGYGVMSFGEKALPSVIRYIAHQKQRHANQNLNAYLERLE